MFLIPYLYKKKESIYTVHIIHIFLNQGTLLINIDVNVNVNVNVNDDIDSFCSVNGFIYKKKIIIDNMCYIELDTVKTDIESFYTYHENSDAECLRRFICVGNDNEDYLHINATNPPFIIPVLKEVLRLSE